MEGRKKLLLSVLLLGIFLFSFASVNATLDTKSFDKNDGKYGKIKINDYLFLNKVDYTLTDYDTSVVNAWAEGEYIMYKKTHLFTGIFYKDILGNKGNLKNVQFYIWNEENETKYRPLYENQNCYLDANYTEEEWYYGILINDTWIEKCDSVLISNDSYDVDISRWIPYEKGMDLEEGKGRWRIEAERPINQAVDFVLEAHGKEFTEWAWWNQSWAYAKEYTNLTGNISYMEINKTENDNPGFTDTRFLSCISDTLEFNHTLEATFDGQALSYNSGISPYTSGLVAGYKLDNNDFSDVTGVNNGTNIGSTNTSGIILDARDFDGTQDYITISNDASLNFGTGDYSIQVWVKTSYSSVFQQVLGKFQNGAPFQGYGIRIEDTTGFVKHQRPGSTETTGDVDVTDGEWHHIITTFDSGAINGMKIYIDGVEDTSATVNADSDNVDNTNNLYIGIAQDAASFDMNGSIDEVMIFNRSLSQTEVFELYNGTKGQFRLNNLGENCTLRYYGNSEATSTSSASDVYFEPVSAYYFDANANDFVGGNHGTVTGATLTTGYINGSYSFDGGTNEIDLANDISLTGDFTYSTWIDIDTNANHLFVDSTETTGNEGRCRFDSTGIVMGSSSVANLVINNGTQLSTGAGWQHLVITRTSGTMGVWIDGVNTSNSISLTGTVIINNFGGKPNYATGVAFFDGLMDEIRIYDYAISSDQIGRLFTETAPNITEGAQQSQNNPPIITANTTKPDTVYPDTDYLVNLTIEDEDVGDTLTAYTQFYVNGALTSTEQSTVVTNGTNTLVSTLNSGNFSAGDNLTAQVWAGDEIDNTTKFNLTSSFVNLAPDTTPPNVTDLTEYPSDPTTYSHSTIYSFNATVIDGGTLDDVLLEIAGINYTATNLSADIFSASFANLSAGIHNYRWFANDSDGNFNSSETGIYTINQETSQTSLTFSVPSPQTYGTPITPTCSLTVGDGPVVLEMDGDVITSGVALVAGAGARTFNCSYAETTNYTGGENISVYTIDKAIPEGVLTSSIGWNINESQEVTIGLSEGNPNDGDVAYIVYRDNVDKGTGETWSPSYGTYYYVLNTTGGANWTVNVSMDTQTLTVGDNTYPDIDIVYPINNTIYASVVTELNYTVSDLNLDSCWYSLDGGLSNTTITCGDNVTGLNSGQGFSTWQVWINDSDNNINTSITTFSVDSFAPNITALTEYPTDPTNYSQETIYDFSSTITDSSSLNTVLFEFNGTNYTATNLSASVFNVSFTNLSVGTYNYRWFANDSVGNFNNSESDSYTIDKATPNLVLNGTTPITYGTATDFVGSGCPVELNCTLDIENNVYAAGNVTANYSTPGNVNYTSAYANFTITINKASLAGTITGTTPINYTSIANITANETNNNDSDVAYILYRDNVTVSNPDNTILGVGTYYYIYNSTGGENYTSNANIDSFTLVVDKMQGEVYAYIGNLRANYLGNNLTAKNEYLNGSLNVGLGNISMYLNNTLINSGASPLFNVTDFQLGSYYFNVTYGGNDNYTSAEEHWAINISVWFLSNLTGVFNLNAGSGDIAYDISGNNNNGTIEGASWANDDIDITLLEDFDYSVGESNGLFVLLNDALDRTFIEITYVYFEYDEDSLESILIKIIPGLIMLLILVMIIRLLMKRNDVEEVYAYDY